MKPNVADQSVIQVRWGPGTYRPISPQQPAWQGLPPPGVKKVLTRDALDKEYRDWYAKWASNFALLTDDFVAQVVKGERNRIEQLKPGKWETFPFLPEYHCVVGDDYLWVQGFDGGCTVELCYPDFDPDVRILTIDNMPVLCSDGPRAAALAQACYPASPANLVWRSYW